MCVPIVVGEQEEIYCVRSPLLLRYTHGEHTVLIPHNVNGDGRVLFFKFCNVGYFYWIFNTGHVQLVFKLSVKPYPVVLMSVVTVESGQDAPQEAFLVVSISDVDYTVPRVGDGLWSGDVRGGIDGLITDDAKVNFQDSIKCPPTTLIDPLGHTLHDLFASLHELAYDAVCGEQDSSLPVEGGGGREFLTVDCLGKLHLDSDVPLHRAHPFDLRFQLFEDGTTLPGEGRDDVIVVRLEATAHMGDRDEVSTDGYGSSGAHLERQIPTTD